MNSSISLRVDTIRCYYKMYYEMDTNIIGLNSSWWENKKTFFSSKTSYG